MSRKANIEIEQGCSFSTEVEIINDDLTPFEVDGWTGHGSIRKHYLSETDYPFSVTLQDGLCTFQMDASDTAELEAGLYVYDVVIVSGATTHRVVSGMATVSPSVYKG